MYKLVLNNGEIQFMGIRKQVFVILHYKNVKDTMNCINSILKLDGSKDIVIVDNGSKDRSIKELRERYKTEDSIYFVLNKKNLGFARGNNVGYQFAREKLKADFIYICNNDIVFDQRDFINRTVQAYKRKPVYVIGPDIESLDNNEHQSPMNGAPRSTIKVKFEILRYSILLSLNYLNLYNVLRRKKKSKVLEEQSYYMKKRENTTLHGAMLIFTPKYVKKENIAFRKETFLYMEEDILYLYLMMKGYSTLYAPELHVYHREDAATNALFNDNKAKRKFIFINMRKSLKIYKKYLIAYGKINRNKQLRK